MEKNDGAINKSQNAEPDSGLCARDIAKMIDHSLLHPGLTDQELEMECKIAVECDAAAVCVKPCHAARASELLAGTDVMVSAVIGFPHGNSTTAVKLFETEQVLEDGANEVDMVVNIGKVLSRDWVYVEREISQINRLTKQYNAILKVIFENDLLPDDEFKIKLCRICSKCGVAFVKTSTGYNYNKDEDGRYSYKGATEHDLKLMRQYSSPDVQVKAAGSVSTLDAILKVREWGVTRVGTKGTKKAVDDAKTRFGR